MKNILLIIALLFFGNINAQEIKFGKVSKAELEEKFYPLDSTVDAAYLLKKRKTYFIYDINTGFKVITDYHERIKIYTKKGFKYANKKISYYKPESGTKEKISSIKAYTFNIEKGKIVKQKLSKKDIFDEQLNKYRSQKKITHPNIKQGAVIDLKYTLISPYNNIKQLNFQYTIPVKQLDFKVDIPEYYIFNKKTKGYFNIPLKESSSRDKINFGQNIFLDYTTTKYSFTQKNIPYIKENEPFSGNINNYIGGIQFELSGTKFPNSIYENYSTNWEGVCRSIYESSSFGYELEKNNYYKEDLTILLKTSKNDFEKIGTIFNYVKSRVKWNEHFRKYTNKGVKKAYKEGVGNSAEINLMLTSMLRFAGIDANPVLVSTKNNGIPLYPTREGYNYVISKVNLSNGESVLLDATEKYSLPNILPYRVLNWFGRELLKNGISKRISLNPSIYPEKKHLLHVKIDEFGAIEGMFRKSFLNHSAMSYRRRNNLIKNEDLITSLEDEYNIEVEDFKLLNKDNFSKPITQSLKFSGEDFIEEINNKLYFSPLFFLAKKENPFKSKERNFPIDYGTPWKNTFSVAITIPENYTVESFPEAIAIGLPKNIGVFKYKVTITGNKIKLSSLLQINRSTITSGYYTLLRKFYTQLVKKQAEKIVLIKK